MRKSLFALAIFASTLFACAEPGVSSRPEISSSHAPFVYSELKDGEVADQVVEANDKYYILNMDAVFDKDATESRKEEIVNERKQELIEDRIQLIQRIEAMPNQETPKYFYKVKKDLLTKWDGKKVKDAMREINPQTDVITGASYSSNAVVENLKRGLQYYQKHKK